MLITKSTMDDIEAILRLYAHAIEYQKSKLSRHWHSFDEKLLANEIQDGRHWKMMEQLDIACIFSIAFTDRLLWDERDEDPSIYLHRIVTNPDYYGKRYVPHIIDWAKEHGRNNRKQFIRLDTFHDDHQLNDYYIRCGFTLCGIKSFDKAEKVPPHYQEGALSLLELKIV